MHARTQQRRQRERREARRRAAPAATAMATTTTTGAGGNLMGLEAAHSVLQRYSSPIAHVVVRGDGLRAARAGQEGSFFVEQHDGSSLITGEDDAGGGGGGVQLVVKLRRRLMDPNTGRPTSAVGREHGSVLGEDPEDRGCEVVRPQVERIHGRDAAAWKVSYTLTVAGRWEALVALRFKGQRTQHPVPGSPFALTVQPGKLHCGSSLVSGPGLLHAVVGCTTLLDVITRDRFGNRLKMGGATVVLKAQSGTINVDTVVDNLDGSYSVQFTPTEAPPSAMHTRPQQQRGDVLAPSPMLSSMALVLFVDGHSVSTEPLTVPLSLATADDAHGDMEFRPSASGDTHAGASGAGGLYRGDSTNSTDHHPAQSQQPPHAQHKRPGSLRVVRRAVVDAAPIPSPRMAAVAADASVAAAESGGDVGARENGGGAAESGTEIVSVLEPSSPVAARRMIRAASASNSLPFRAGWVRKKGKMSWSQRFFILIHKKVAEDEMDFLLIYFHQALTKQQQLPDNWPQLEQSCAGQFGLTGADVGVSASKPRELTILLNTGRKLTLGVKSEEKRNSWLATLATAVRLSDRDNSTGRRMRRRSSEDGNVAGLAMNADDGDGEAGDADAAADERQQERRARRARNAAAGHAAAVPPRFSTMVSQMGSKAREAALKSATNSAHSSGSEPSSYSTAAAAAAAAAAAHPDDRTNLAGDIAAAAAVVVAERSATKASRDGQRQEEHNNSAPSSASSASSSSSSSSSTSSSSAPSTSSTSSAMHPMAATDNNNNNNGADNGKTKTARSPTERSRESSLVASETSLLPDDDDEVVIEDHTDRGRVAGLLGAPRDDSRDSMDPAVRRDRAPQQTTQPQQNGAGLHFSMQQQQQQQQQPLPPQLEAPTSGVGARRRSTRTSDESHNLSGSNVSISPKHSSSTGGAGALYIPPSSALRVSLGGPLDDMTPRSNAATLADTPHAIPRTNSNGGSMPGSRNGSAEGASSFTGRPSLDSVSGLAPLSTRASGTGIVSKGFTLTNLQEPRLVDLPPAWTGVHELQEIGQQQRRLIDETVQPFMAEISQFRDSKWKQSLQRWHMLLPLADVKRLVFDIQESPFDDRFILCTMLQRVVEIEGRLPEDVVPTPATMGMGVAKEDPRPVSPMDDEYMRSLTDQQRERVLRDRSRRQEEWEAYLAHMRANGHPNVQPGTDEREAFFSMLEQRVAREGQDDAPPRRVRGQHGTRRSSPLSLPSSTTSSSNGMALGASTTAGADESSSGLCADTSGGRPSSRRRSSGSINGRESPERRPSILASEDWSHTLRDDFDTSSSHKSNTKLAYASAAGVVNSMYDTYSSMESNGTPADGDGGGPDQILGGGVTAGERSGSRPASAESALAPEMPRKLSLRLQRRASFSKQQQQGDAVTNGMANSSGREHAGGGRGRKRSPSIAQPRSRSLSPPPPHGRGAGRSSTGGSTDKGSGIRRRPLRTCSSNDMLRGTRQQLQGQPQPARRRRRKSLQMLMRKDRRAMIAMGSSVSSSAAGPSPGSAGSGGGRAYHPYPGQHRYGSDSDGSPHAARGHGAEGSEPAPSDTAHSSRGSSSGVRSQRHSPYDESSYASGSPHETMSGARSSNGSGSRAMVPGGASTTAGASTSEKGTSESGLVANAGWLRVSDWLGSIGMARYCDNFRSAGLMELSRIELLSGADLREMNIHEGDIPDILAQIRVFSYRTKVWAQRALQSRSRSRSRSHSRSRSRSRSLGRDRARMPRQAARGRSASPPPTLTQQQQQQMQQRGRQRLPRGGEPRRSQSQPPAAATASSAPPSDAQPAVDRRQTEETRVPPMTGREGVEAIGRAIRELDASRLMVLWDTILPDDASVRGSEAYEASQQLAFNLHVFAAIAPILKQQPPEYAQESMSQFKRYLDLEVMNQPELLKSREFAQYVALPLVPNPSEHPAFSHLFSDRWCEQLRTRVTLFLEVVLSATMDSAPLTELTKTANAPTTSSPRLSDRHRRTTAQGTVPTMGGATEVSAHGAGDEPSPPRLEPAQFRPFENSNAQRQPQQQLQEQQEQQQQHMATNASSSSSVSTDAGEVEGTLGSQENGSSNSESTDDNSSSPARRLSATRGAGNLMSGDIDLTRSTSSVLADVAGKRRDDAEDEIEDGEVDVADTRKGISLRKRQSWNGVPRRKQSFVPSTIGDMTAHVLHSRHGDAAVLNAVQRRRKSRLLAGQTTVGPSPKATEQPPRASGTSQNLQVRHSVNALPMAGQQVQQARSHSRQAAHASAASAKAAAAAAFQEASDAAMRHQAMMRGMSSSSIVSVQAGGVSGSGQTPSSSPDTAGDSQSTEPQLPSPSTSSMSQVENGTRATPPDGGNMAARAGAPSVPALNIPAAGAHATPKSSLADGDANDVKPLTPLGARVAAKNSPVRFGLQAEPHPPLNVEEVGEQIVEFESMQAQLAEQDALYLEWLAATRQSAMSSSSSSSSSSNKTAAASHNPSARSTQLAQSSWAQIVPPSPRSIKAVEAPAASALVSTAASRYSKQRMETSSVPQPDSGADDVSGQGLGDRHGSDADAVATGADVNDAAADQDGPRTPPYPESTMVLPDTDVAASATGSIHRPARRAPVPPRRAPPPPPVAVEAVRSAATHASPPPLAPPQAGERDTAAERQDHSSSSAVDKPNGACRSDLDRRVSFEAFLQSLAAEEEEDADDGNDDDGAKQQQQRQRLQDANEEDGEGSSEPVVESRTPGFAGACGAPSSATADKNATASASGGAKVGERTPASSSSASAATPSARWGRPVLQLPAAPPHNFAGTTAGTTFAEPAGFTREPAPDAVAEEGTPGIAAEPEAVVEAEESHETEDRATLQGKGVGADREHRPAVQKEKKGKEEKDETKSAADASEADDEAAAFPTAASSTSSQAATSAATDEHGEHDTIAGTNVEDCSDEGSEAEEPEAGQEQTDSVGRGSFTDDDVDGEDVDDDDRVDFLVVETARGAGVEAERSRRR